MTSGKNMQWMPAPAGAIMSTLLTVPSKPGNDTESSRWSLNFYVTWGRLCRVDKFHVVWPVGKNKMMSCWHGIHTDVLHFGLGGIRTTGIFALQLNLLLVENFFKQFSYCITFPVLCFSGLWIIWYWKDVMPSCLNFQLSKQNKIEQCIYHISSQFSGGLIGFALSLCCYGDAGVGGGWMWGSQSSHEADQSHDQGRGGMAAPVNTYSE